MVVLKTCEPELSFILAKLFNKCLKESCFPDPWKVSSVVPLFKNVQERSHSVLPPGIREGMIFVSSARQGGATAKLQEPGWGHIQGGR